MAKSKKTGFRYYVTEDMLDRYRKKPALLRLEWLYMANVLRKECSKRIIRIQDMFRQEKI